MPLAVRARGRDILGHSWPEVVVMRELAAVLCLVLFVAGCPDDESETTGGTSNGGGGAGAGASGGGGSGGAEALCGNGTVDPGETCDGNCVAACDDFDGCTEDTLEGSALTCTAECIYTAVINTCADGDDCCPAGCDRTTDSDCPYYVDATSGNDANDGLTPETAWQTVGHVNAFALVPGDRVAFKRGEQWREALDITQAGEPGNPIIFQSYGSAADKPALVMSTAVSGWTAAGGMTATYVADLATSTNQVLVDGVRLPVAHDPNDGYYYVDQAEPSVTPLSFVDAELSGDPVGATAFIRTVRWAFEEGQVVSFANGRLTLDVDGDYGEVPEQAGYVLTNRLWMLDSPGEWFYDESAGKLYVRLADDSDPASHQIEASTSDVGIRVHADSVIVDNLEVRHARQIGIAVDYVDAVVRRCTVESAALLGLALGATGNTIIEASDNTIRNSGNGAIRATTDESQTEPIEILRNQALDTMPSFPEIGSPAHVTVGWEDGARGFAVRLWGQGFHMAENVVRGAGYDCVSLGGHDGIVEHNLLEQCCLILDDCGGVYMGGNGHIIRENIVRDCIGNAEGTADWFDSKGTAAQGIYPDDASYDIHILGNTVINADWSVQIHNSHDDEIRGNTLYQWRDSGIMLSEDSIVGLGATRDNVTEENTFYSQTGRFAIAERGWIGGHDFGTYDYNRYWHDDTHLLFSTTDNTSGSVTNDYSLAEWQAATGYDVHSTDLAEGYQVVTCAGDPTGSELVPNGTFDADMSSWGIYADGDGAIEWVSSCGLDGGCLHASATTSTVGALLFHSSISVTSGTGYQIRMSLISPDLDAASVLLRRDADPWDGVAPAIAASMGPTRTDHVWNVVANDSTTARIDLATGGTDTDYFIDNVSLREATIYDNDPTDDSTILLNPSAVDAPVVVPAGRYCDLEGNEVGGQVVLAPYGSQILVSCLCNGDHTCNNLETAESCAGDCP